MALGALVLCTGLALVTATASGPGLELHAVETLVSEEAETNVVGAFFAARPSDTDALDSAVALLEPSMFTRRDLGLVFEAERRLRGRGEPVDVTTLAEELKGQERFDEMGGYDLLSQLVDAVPSAANVEYHAKIVREYAVRRQLRSDLRAGLNDISAIDRPLDEVLAEIQARLGTHERATVGGCPFRFLSEDDLAALHQPDAYLEGVIPAGGLFVLLGDPETGKTFLLFDLACSSSAGIKNWHGLQLQAGPVVYVLAEGVSGAPARIRAWKDSQRIDKALSGLTVVPDPIALHDPSSVAAFLRELGRLPEPPIAVFIDTLARNMAGADENSTSDMGAAIRGMDRIRETGATVIVAHHLNKAGTGRGNSALPGAADGIARLSTQGSLRVLQCVKAKDLPHFEPISFRLKAHAGSAIITPVTRSGVTGVMGWVLTPSELETLRSLRNNSIGDGLPVSKWEELTECGTSTFYEHRRVLWDRGLVRTDRPGKGARYSLTEKGEALFTPEVR